VLDFVDHDHGGPASRWAASCEIGSTITVRGPGGKKLVDPSADWFLIAGDMSALPAISVNLETLPAHARGYAVIEVLDDDDIQPLAIPDGVQLHWVVDPHGTRNEALIARLRSLPWLPGRAYPWFAGEFHGMREARAYLRGERAIDRQQMYLSCYWKHGDTDEQMKAAKRRDAEENG
ncbi:MAG: siderophore-interacting protein, partial [Pseudomonadota bacterium]